MPIDLEKLGISLETVQFNPYDEINERYEVTVAGKTFLVSLTKSEVDLWLKNQRAFGAVYDILRQISFYINESGGVLAAYQEITVDIGTNTTTTVVANDTLITASQSGVEFNWNDPRLEFGRSVNLEPALGVEQMGFVLDTGAHINPAVLHAVAADGTISHNLQMDCVSTAPGEPTHLIRRQWSNDSGDWDLDPVAWENGQKLHLTQLLVQEATAL